jgi:hypothetical protein
MPRRRGFFGFAFCLALFFAHGALAQSGGNVIKTPPLRESETLPIRIDIHQTAANPPYAGWAGGIVKTHILDASELDLDGIHPLLPARRLTATGPLSFAASVPILSPFGARSQNLQSVPLLLTFIVPDLSGIDVQPSALIPLFDLGLHAKGTDVGQNSDADVSFMFWNVWHTRPGPGSTLVRLDPSDLLWVASNIQDVGQLHTVLSNNAFPAVPLALENANGHWLHIDQPMTFHLFGGQGSQYYAKLVGTSFLGVEHAPEPITGLLVGIGLAALGSGGYLRHRRLA